MRYATCVLLAWVAAGCEPSPTDDCEPGTTRACTCPDGRASQERCMPDASGWASCECGLAPDAGGAPSCAVTCGGCCEVDSTCVTGNSVVACGIGGSACVACAPDQSCVDGICRACEPSCEGRECGDDGCGGVCVPGCSTGQTCAAGSCVSAGCTTCAECGPDEACLSGSCASVWGRLLRITLEGASFPDRTSSGACWDIPGCGPPDPSVVVSTSGRDARIACSDDTLTPAWSQYVDVLPFRSDSIDFRLLDEDAGGAAGCDGYTNDEECGFRWLGPEHPDYTGVSSIRDLVCAGRFDGIVCPGLAFSFSIGAP